MFAELCDQIEILFPGHRSNQFYEQKWLKFYFVKIFILSLEGIEK